MTRAERTRIMRANGLWKGGGNVVDLEAIERVRKIAIRGNNMDTAGLIDLLLNRPKKPHAKSN